MEDIQTQLHPWEVEDQVLPYTETAHGFQIYIERGPNRALCGYVSIPESSPLFKVDRNTDIPISVERFERETSVDNIGILNTMSHSRPVQSADSGKAPLWAAFDCHGGLSYSGPVFSRELAVKFGKTSPDEVWLLGFDCSHAGDYCPPYSPVPPMWTYDPNGEWREYRNLEYVKDVCRKLAAQIADYHAKEGAVHGQAGTD